MSKYSIGGLEFQNKEAIKRHCKSLVEKYKDADKIPYMDAKFLFDLIKWHPHSKQKIGEGIKYFKVIKTTYGNYGFYITRLDGSGTDFSYLHCISPRNKKTDFLMACRNTVRPQIKEFRDFNWHPGLTCPITGEDITFDNLHIDHIPPMTFNSIVNHWVSDNLIDIDAVEINGYGDNEISKIFADEKLTNSFYEYHEMMAKLRIVSRKGNQIIEQQRKKAVQNGPTI